MTNGWTDIQNADLILAMGGNPAENHPVGFRFVMEAKRNRNAKLVSVDPRFNRTAAVADSFTQIRTGTDIAFLGGLINYALTRNRIHADYVRLFTNATFLVREDYSFNEQEGLFSGWNPEKKTYDKSSWNYELDAKGFAKVDETMQHPRCVFQIMKTFYSRYTPEMVSSICGCKKEDFLKAAELITSTYPPDKVGTIMYALGWTHHSFSVQLIHAAAMLQLLLGNIGMTGGGLNALRGHANIQGGTDNGMAYHNLPGYIAIPKADHESLKAYLDAVTPKPLRPNSMNFWSNTDRFFVSQMKAYYGKAATKQNDFAYHWHPKLPQTPAGGYENWSWAFIFDHMYNGKMEGFFSFGMNPVNNGPNSSKAVAAVSKLKWLYSNPSSPSQVELCKEINGWAIEDLKDEKDPKTIVLKAGQQVGKFLDLRADGSTLSGDWLHIGMYTEAGNLTQRRNNADPSGLGRYPEWTFNWPANRRVMYNRCSADAQGKPWDPTRPGIVWNGEKWVGDVPDYKVDSPPEAGLGAFILLPEGVARLFIPGQFAEGPWSEFYEPMESPVANPLHAKQSSSPAVKQFKTEWDKLAKTGGEFDIACTTYRLTEHFHYWTKNNAYNMQLQPEFFVEIPEELAREKGIGNGEKVRVTSARGSIEGKAMVTKRIKPMQVAGKQVYQIGFPIHWGFLGRGEQKGSMANLVTPTIVDPNSFAPEYKGFLVKLEKV